MARYEASFEIDSRSDAYAARRILERTYDTVREESRTLRDGAADTTDLVEAFETLRNATDPPAPGTLTITYERSGEGFDD